MLTVEVFFFFFFSSRRRHTRYWRDWSSDVCSSDLEEESYQENLIRAKPRNQRKTLPSMMFRLITFTNNPNRPTSSQVQATGWCKSASQGRPCGGAGKCP